MPAWLFQSGAGSSSGVFMGKITRRDFVKTTAIGAAGLVAFKASLRDALAFYQSPGIPLFATNLRGAGPGGIPVAVPDHWKSLLTGATHYSIDIAQFRDQVTPLSSGLGKTTFWGYVPGSGLGGYTTPTHLGGIIIGQRGTPIQITFQNKLPFQSIIPVDRTQMFSSDSNLVNRTAVHLHGGLVPWISDGGPFDWFSPYYHRGSSFLNNEVLNPIGSLIPGCAEYYYPLDQSARFLWYHDHAHGITRTNAYAGIASGLLLRDAFEAGLMNAGLPGYIEAGGNELPLIVQDKIFVGRDLSSVDPGYQGLRIPGSLWYAHTYEPNQQNGTGRWDLGVSGLALPQPSCVAEFFGDTMLVNGTTFPEVTVQARRYRLRLLDACNARFLNLQLYIDDGSANGITLDANGAPTNQPFLNAAALDSLGTPTSNWLQIGNEAGFLARPVLIPSSQPLTFLPSPNLVNPQNLAGINPDPDTGQTDPSSILASLLMAPAERPDVIVDFSAVPKNSNGSYKSVILYSDAPAPFPSGDDRNDYFPGWNIGSGNFGIGNPTNGITKDGFGPNTRVLMRFKVVPASGSADGKLNIDTTTNLQPGIDPLFVGPDVVQNGVPAPPGVKKRLLTLNEYFDSYGRLIQILGNAQNPYGSPYAEPDTYLNYGPGALPATIGASGEYVKSGDTEVWEIFNTTGDVHPMHFHLVNVQVINRQLFDLNDPTFSTLAGPIMPPSPNELGWKETVPMYPGTVTRVIMKFDMSQCQIVGRNGRTIRTPRSPRTGGAEYVWHCHILEHEEHDMMHALVVT
jgi:spore coat protein A, manganese oxidase